MIRRLALLCMAALLTACATPATHAPASTSSAAPGAPAADTPAVYSLDIQVDDSALRDLLQEHLDLARYRANQAALSRVELARLAAAAPAQAEALLETEGHFNAKAEVSRDPQDDTRLRLTVMPGPLTRVDQLKLSFTEGLADDNATAQALRRSLQDAWPLPAGAAFTQSAWAAGKSDLLVRARTGGFPLARWADTAARVDPETHTAELELVLASGPQARLGVLRIEGLQRQDRSAVERLAGFSPGDAYTEQKLAEFQERLAKTQLFDAVRVQLLPETPDADGTTPIQVSLTESPLQQATVAVGYHSNTGQSLSVEHLHRRPFDLPLRARTKLQYSRDLRGGELELSSHPQPDLHRNIGALQFEEDRTGDTRVQNLGLRVGRLYESPRDERLSYLELLRARETAGAEVSTHLAVSANQQWIRRRLDSTLLPTDGHQALALVGLGHAQGGGAQGAFGRVQFKLGVYQPLGGWYTSARAEVAQVVAHDRVGMPEKLLFLAGGDESVRGYAYRSLGVERNGITVGGRVLGTGSLEIARPFSLRMPSLWGALFVDAGNAASRWADYRPVVGYGAGLRWRSPVGPLRVDMARAQETGKWRLHFSVGISL
ncbi:autotransporter assembly complex protein TamA [Roseateles sp. BYS87W]|uniref:Autotransporter assembly complex family protein n=1 Tax=Pelomonas baiyunensis TaxID=3299026 RepID=A0ABW7GUM7_9BURK